MSSIIKIGKLLLKYKFRFIFGVIFMLFYSLFSVAPVHYLKNITDALLDAVKEEEVLEMNKFLLVGFGLVVVMGLKGISYFFQNYLMGWLSQKVIKDLREKLYNKMILMPIAFFNKTATGSLTSRFTVDFVTLNQAITVGIVGPMRDIPMIFILIGIMINRSWKLLLLTLILLPVAGYLISFFGKQNKKVTKKRLNQFGELTALLTETITGIRVVKAFSMEKYEKDRFEEENTRLYKHFMHSIRISSYSYPLLELTASCCAVPILAYGGYLIIHGEMTFGDFVSFMGSFMMLNEPIKKLNGISLKIQEGIAASNRIFEVLDSDWKIEEDPRAKVLPPIQKEVAVDIDQFGYDENVVLEDIHIKLKAGTVTALVGSSGSGKTTLANLIPRFFNLDGKDGTIMIDGQDLNTVTLDSLRNQIAIVTQEIVLFNDSIKNNISYGDIKCSENDIIKAAQAGHAHQFITEMPNGYDQQIGEKGVLLSGGQRQRLSISRALIKNAPILILDEATSALDTESEKEVQAAIENLMKDRTSLVIAHRLSTIKHADVIHVMKNGRIIESGKHQELIEKKGEYHRLYEMQFTDIKKEKEELKQLTAE